MSGVTSSMEAAVLLARRTRCGLTVTRYGDRDRGEVTGRTARALEHSGLAIRIPEGPFVGNLILTTKGLELAARVESSEQPEHQDVQVPRPRAVLPLEHRKAIESAQRDLDRAQQALEQTVIAALDAGASLRVITDATGIAGTTVQRWAKKHGRSVR